MGGRPRYPSSQIAKAVTVAIPAQALAQALATFCDQTGMQFVYLSAVLSSHCKALLNPEIGCAPANDALRVASPPTHGHRHLSVLDSPHRFPRIVWLVGYHVVMRVVIDCHSFHKSWPSIRRSTVSGVLRPR
jgi:hypothetical protein